MTDIITDAEEAGFASDLTQAEHVRRVRPRLRHPCAWRRHGRSALDRSASSCCSSCSDFANDRFLSNLNMANLITQAGSIIILAMALVPVLLLGDIDLSAGVAGGVAACVMGVLLVKHDQPVVRRRARSARAFGAAIGLVIGLLVAKLGIPSFVVTLAFFLGLQGVTLKLIGEGGSVRVDEPVISGIANDNMSVVCGLDLGHRHHRAVCGHHAAGASPQGHARASASAAGCRRRADRDQSARSCSSSPTSSTRTAASTRTSRSGHSVRPADGRRAAGHLDVHPRSHDAGAVMSTPWAATAKRPVEPASTSPVSASRCSWLCSSMAARQRHRRGVLRRQGVDHVGRRQ